MCCFCLHFSALMCYSFKNLLQFTFEKNNLMCKKREKNNLSQGKIPAPPPLDIKWSVPYVSYIRQNNKWYHCDDKHITETNLLMVSNNVYLVFYAKEINIGT